MKRGRDPGDSTCSDEKRAQVGLSMLSNSSASKTAIAKILMSLHKAGCLVEGVVPVASVDHIRKDIARASDKIASARTPYGPVIQQLDLETTPPTRWDYIHPLALVFFLSTICSQFGAMMARTIDKHGSMLKIAVYIDEVRPGNVLRPDKARSVHNLYWAFIEWPEWFLCRDSAWLNFGCCRTSVVANINGGISCFIKQVLHAFWNPKGPNFSTTGCLFQRSPHDLVLVRASLGGMLGDEKGLKEVFASKGFGGTRPCMACKHICQYLDNQIQGHPVLRPLHCLNRSEFGTSTDADIYAIVDMLEHTATSGTQAQLALLEQSSGVNYEPTGVLFDRHCRSFVKPATGFLRDWMHVLLVGGLFNIEIQQILGLLPKNGIALTSLTAYFAEFKLPKERGSISSDWFTPKRMGRPSDDKDGWKAFSSEVLNCVPILMSFLDLVVKPMGILSRNIECFSLAHRIMDLVSLGSESAVPFVDELEATIAAHNAMFLELYGDVIKPKFHFLYHIVDHIRSIGRLLNCFVTERKHRSVKTLCAHIFNNFEKTLTRDVLVGLVDKMTSEDLFHREHLLNPRPVDLDTLNAFRKVYPGLPEALHTSTRATLPVGIVSKGDLVMTVDKRVGEVCLFIACNSNDGCIVWCSLKLYEKVSTWCYKQVVGDSVVVSSEDVLEALTWCKQRDTIRVLPPRASVTWR